MAETGQMNKKGRPLKELNLIDDFLFDVATVDLESCKIMIELSLGIHLKGIRWKEGQKVIHNLPGKRGIRMDFCVEDEEGNFFDVEMQKRNQGNIPKRTRFYQAMLDAPILKSGEESFDSLNPCYIVVICGFDLYGYGKYRYTFGNYCEEVPGLLLGDECKKIVLNTRGNNDSEVEQSLIDFLHYVEQSGERNLSENCDERLRRLHEKVIHIKSSEEMEAAYMRMEERDRLIREDGKAEGEARKLIQIVCRMLQRGSSPKEIAEVLGEDILQIQEICRAAEKFAPDYDREAVCQAIQKEEGR